MIFKKTPYSQIYFLLCCVVLLTGCTQKQIVEENGAGNNVNSSFITHYKDEIFYVYVDSSDGRKDAIYRIKDDGSKNTCLTVGCDYHPYLCATDKYVFYYNGYEKTLYRINHNGDNKKSIFYGTCWETYIYNNMLYYGYSNGDYSAICCSDYDGNNCTTIWETNTGGYIRFAIEKDQVFITNFVDKAIYKMNLDGSKLSKIYEDEHGAFHIIAYKNRIYFIFSYDVDTLSTYGQHCIASINTNGKDFQLITEEQGDGFSSINIYENWLYISDYNNKCIRRISLDGQEEQRLNIPMGFDPGEIQIINGWLYNRNIIFDGESVFGRIGRTSLDGSKCEIFTQH